jgi:hypothetical protein
MNRAVPKKIAYDCSGVTFFPRKKRPGNILDFSRLHVEISFTCTQ